MNHGEYYITYDLVIITLSISLMVPGVVLFLLWKKKPFESEETLPVKLRARAYSLMDIYAATDGFNHKRFVGKGCLGTVYAAGFQDHKGSELVAGKRIHPVLVLSNACGFGFSSVLRLLSSAQHPNIVPIMGFSEAPGERIILMEFVRMVSLGFYLHQNTTNGASSSLLD